MEEVEVKLDATFIKQFAPHAMYVGVKTKPIVFMWGKGNNGKSALMKSLSNGMKRRIEVREKI